MAALSSSHSPHFSLKIDSSKYGAKPSHSSIRMCLRSPPSITSRNKQLLGKHVAGIATQLSSEKGFLGRSRAIFRLNRERLSPCTKGFRVKASCKSLDTVSERGLSNSQIASSVFTLGTAAVLPFYTLMVIAPKAQLQIRSFNLGRREYSTTSRAFVNWFARMQMQTKKCMKSSLPYIVLGILYVYLLYLSWRPDTFRLMFASKYWLPELPGMAKMFSNEMTLSSAWIHLLAVDLFAARQVYHDGLEKKIETRHSISLCLMFCPIGIVSHFITKLVTRTARKSTPEPGIH